MNKISVIIPVYNAEKFLSVCLDSVINQTYSNLEIILVNDGATDSSPEICEAYALKDSRIILVHQKNLGPSEARNSGLEKATGDFITFVDNDDLLAKNFFQKLLEVLLEYDADIVECGFYKFKTEGEIPTATNLPTGNIEIYQTQKALGLLMEENLKQTVWNKIYRREVVSGILFPLAKTIEDEFWTYKVFGNSKKIVKITDSLYYYRQQNESIIGQAYSIKRLEGLCAFEERIEYIQNNFPSLKNLAIKKFCLGSIYHYQMLTKHHKIDPDGYHREKIYTEVKKFNKLSIYIQWRIKEILFYKVFVVSPSLLYKLKKII